jgi:hypothetical protein
VLFGRHRWFSGGGGGGGGVVLTAGGAARGLVTDRGTLVTVVCAKECADF